jgi:hypothetical protein
MVTGGAISAAGGAQDEPVNGSEERKGPAVNSRKIHDLI